jgi:hypothetical protein
MFGYSVKYWRKIIGTSSSPLRDLGETEGVEREKGPCYRCI